MYKKKAKLSSRLSLSKDSEHQTIITTLSNHIVSYYLHNFTRTATTYVDQHIDYRWGREKYNGNF